MRKLLVFVLFVVLFLGAPPASAGVKSDEADFVSRINTLRASQGLARLRVNANLTNKARKWAGRMAARRRIWHSDLADGVTANWHKLGENVGRGGSVAALHAAFVNSPRHYANLVDPAFRYVGVGVVTVDGTSFVSEVFMQRRLTKRTPRRASATAPRRPAARARTASRSTAPPSLGSANRKEHREEVVHRSAGRRRCAGRQ